MTWQAWREFLFGTPRRAITTVIVGTLIAGTIHPPFLGAITRRLANALVAALIPILDGLAPLLQIAIIVGAIVLIGRSFFPGKRRRK